MYYHIKKYADEYNIPEDYAFALAYQETHYMGPLHTNYNHKLTSSAGAVGPMQVMLSTARSVNKDGVSLHKLKTDIEYNVMTSMKLLRRLHDKYGDWGLVFGAYNTGQPVVNGYATNILNKRYIWIDDKQN
jgi:soluble lytic murein transglycosylase-like protein